MSRITNVKVYGIEDSLIASGYPMMTDVTEVQTVEQMKKRARVLGNAVTGSGHDSFLKGVVVQFDWQTPVLMQPQIQRYHHIDIISSQSAMHRITSRESFEQSDFGGQIADCILEELNGYLKAYHKEEDAKDKKYWWRKIIYNLPQSYLKIARYTTNYLQLKTMYLQRRHHKLDEWQEFCDWIETLPNFKEFCLGKK